MSQPLFHLAAFWVAVALYAARRGSTADDGIRFVLGLALGAVLAHLGWALLHWQRVVEHPAMLVDPTGGYCVLFVPLGVLVVAWRAGSGFLADALSSLPAALAVARLGCIVGGCCTGAATSLPWGVPGPHGPESDLVHPVALYEIVGLLALDRLAAAAPRDVVPALLLGGLGLLRLALDPLRAPSPFATPPWAVPALAAGLLVVAALMAARTLHTRHAAARVPNGGGHLALPRTSS